MKIKRIISQSKRDFCAIYECEHCGHIEKRSGYNDANFHQNIIPKMRCNKCNKSANKYYRSINTKYLSYTII